jgi:choline dehydrogenase-like flavoprotein
LVSSYAETKYSVKYCIPHHFTSVVTLHLVYYREADVRIGHPAWTAAIGKIIDSNQESQIKGLYVSDASAFPTPLGMPPILTIVALSKRLGDFLNKIQP